MNGPLQVTYPLNNITFVKRLTSVDNIIQSQYNPLLLYYKFMHQTTLKFKKKKTQQNGK